MKKFVSKKKKEFLNPLIFVWDGGTRRAMNETDRESSDEKKELAGLWVIGEAL